MVALGQNDPAQVRRLARQGGGVESARVAGVDAHPDRGYWAGSGAQGLDRNAASRFFGQVRHRVLEVDQNRVGSGIQCLGHPVRAIPGDVEKRVEERRNRHAGQFRTNVGCRVRVVRGRPGQRAAPPLHHPSSRSSSGVAMTSTRASDRSTVNASG